jgi:hypothetical protein
MMTGLLPEQKHAKECIPKYNSPSGSQALSYMMVAHGS